MQHLDWFCASVPRNFNISFGAKCIALPAKYWYANQKCAMTTRTMVQFGLHSQMKSNYLTIRFVKVFFESRVCKI